MATCTKTRISIIPTILAIVLVAVFVIFLVSNSPKESTSGKQNKQTPTQKPSIEDARLILLTVKSSAYPIMVIVEVGNSPPNHSDSATAFYYSAYIPRHKIVEIRLYGKIAVLPIYRITDTISCIIEDVETGYILDIRSSINNKDGRHNEVSCYWKQVV